MELKTILAILYANDMENVVSKAVAIDNQLDCKSEKTTINVRIDAKHLPTGKQFAGQAKSGGYPFTIIGYNQYKLSDNYLVQKPSGETLWTGIDGWHADLVAVEDTPAVIEVA